MKREMIAALLAASCASAPAYAAEVNLYTHREVDLIKPLLDGFTAKTGIKINVVFAKAGLAERIAAEGERGAADALLTVDIATLQQAVAAGITQPVVTETLTKAIPSNLRAADGAWNAMSMRARVIYASKDRVKDAALTYEDLADPRFKGRVCMRDGQHDYNLGVVAAAIGHMGEAKAEEWLKGVRANLAKKPSGGDRDVAKDIAAGLCDIGLGNTYYMGLMAADANQKAWADAVRVIMPSFKGGGTHVNVSGIVMSKYAKNKTETIRLMEWLVSPEAQQVYAAKNFEYPVLAGVTVQPFIASFGPLKADTLPLEVIGKNRKAASELVDRVGFNLGPTS
jgi:iron(III) transport system substrate-binding protein